jgi:anthranilate synthase component 2
MKILIVDNYDSFVYNIVQCVRETTVHGKVPEIEVHHCDAIPFSRLEHFDSVIMSPGPGIPSEAGALMDVIERCWLTHPILGICLGFQAIAEYFGAKLKNLEAPLHGHISPLNIVAPDDKLLHDAPANPVVGRYHSWVVEPSSLPSSLIATSFDEQGNIMSISHESLPIFGLQFHPESFITNFGKNIFQNFLDIRE